MNTDIRKYSWYDKYIVQAADVTGLHDYLRASLESSLEGLAGSSVVTGMDLSSVGGMVLEVAPGGCLSPSGKLLALATATQVTLASDPTLARRSLVVARPKLTVTDQIVDPNNPPSLIDFLTRLGMELVVIPGTPAGTPVYPSAGADDCVLMGVYMAAAAASLSVTNFELAPRQVPKQLRKKIREVSDDYTVSSTDGEDEIIEYDATAGAGIVTLPPASEMVGRELTVIKVDSSSNEVQILPDGGQLISGMASVELDSQWQSLRFYAYKNAWRQC